MAKYTTSATDYNNLAELRQQLGAAAKNVTTHKQRYAMSEHFRKLYMDHRELLDSIYYQADDLGLFKDGVWYHQQGDEYDY